MSFARRTDTHQRCAHLDLAALEELCVLTHRFSLSFVRSRVVVSRPNQIRRWRPAPSRVMDDGSHPPTARTRLTRLVQIPNYQRLFEISQTTRAYAQSPFRATRHRARRPRALILPKQQPTSPCTLLAARRRGAALLAASQVTRCAFARGWPPKGILWRCDGRQVGEILLFWLLNES